LETGSATRIKAIFPSLIISSLRLSKRYYDKRSKEEQQDKTENHIENEQDTVKVKNKDGDEEQTTKEISVELEEEKQDIEEKENEKEKEETVSTTGDAVHITTTTTADAVEEQREDEWFKKMETLYRFIHQLIMILLRECDNTESQCVQFSLMAGNSADYCEFEDVAYNFFLNAFKIYEESVSHSKAQFNGIVYSIGSLLRTSNRLQKQQQYYTTLCTRITLYCTKLLKKPDKSRSIYLSSHLWNDTPSRVLECLQKSLKIADSCMDIVTNELLFLELLNQYIYYYEQENPVVSA
jgi:hypothetical protein